MGAKEAELLLDGTLFFIHWMSSRGINLSDIVDLQNKAKAEGRELSIQDVRGLLDNLGQSIDRLDEITKGARSQV